MNIKWIISGFLLGGVSCGGSALVLGNRVLKKRVKELELQNEDLKQENRRLNEAKRAEKKKAEAVKTDEKKSEDIKEDRSAVKVRKIENKESSSESEDEDEDWSEGKEFTNTMYEETRDNRITCPTVKVNYAKLSKEYRSDSFDEHFEDRVGPTDEDDDEDEEDDDLVHDEDDDGDDKKVIRIISAKQFNENLEYRDNETLTYYQMDDVLVDSANHRIQNEEATIGKECMGLIASMERPEGTEDIDDETDVESFVYVNNEIDDVLYEVIVNHNQNFYRDMAGSYLD